MSHVMSIMRRAPCTDCPSKSEYNAALQPSHSPHNTHRTDIESDWVRLRMTRPQWRSQKFVMEGFKIEAS